MELTRRKYTTSYVFHRVVLTNEISISLDEREVFKTSRDFGTPPYSRKWAEKAPHPKEEIFPLVTSNVATEDNKNGRHLQNWSQALGECLGERAFPRKQDQNIIEG